MASTNDDGLKTTSGSMAAAKKKDENFVPTGGMGQLIHRGDAGSNENKVGNIYMPAPYAVIVEPRNEGGNVTQGDKNYTATYKAYKDAASRLVDQTDEAANLKAAWSVPPKVSINNGNLELSGTSAFLKSNEAKQLREILQGMKGKTYNTEDLNKQVEAWNSTFRRMSEQYLDTVDAMNQANSAIAESAGNAEYHKLTFSDMQKIGNSAKVGKSPEARTSSTKIFVGFDWDKNGKQIEKWVEAKEFFKEFNSMDDDKKRSAYRDLITRSNNGDVGAYSKLTYLNGKSKGKPANVDYDAVGDFFHTMGVNLLTGLAEAADFVTTYVPVFNTARLTGRIVSAASSGDINDFFKSDDVRNMIDDYEEAVNWENAYFSQLTPGSTQAAAIAGSVVGNVLGMAYSIWAGGVGNSAMNTIISRGISSANQALMSTGKFTSFERTVTGVGQAASGGDIMAAGSRAQFMIPTSIVTKFPNFSAALADKALSVMQIAGIGTAGTMPEVLSVGDRVGTLTTNTVAMPGNFANTTTTIANGLTVSTFEGGATISSTIVNTLSGKALFSERMFTNGIATAFRLAPLAGESALRHTDQYLQKVNAGEDVGDMSSYVMENTARDLVWGGALMGAGAVIRKLRGVSAATRVSPASAAEGAFDLGSQDRWYAPGEGHFTYDKGSNLLPSGLEKEKDLQDLVSAIVTANGESIFVSPNRTPVGTDIVAEKSGADFINSRGFTSVFDTQPAGTIANTEYTGDFSSVEFAPIPNTTATDAGKAFGAVSSRTVTSYEVEPTNDGANLVKVTTNIDTNTTTTTKEKFSTIDEATDKARELSIPTTSPKTVANSDALKDATVAPLTINGVTPDVMPKGVSQVKVEPGIIYRTPDALVNDVVNLADREGWHVTNQDRLYRDYERYVQEAQAQQANFEHFDEAPAVPKEMYGTDVDGLIRLAAWAKANNYNLIPMKTASVTERTVKKFSMQDKFISKLADKYQLPELNVASLMVNSRGEENSFYGTNHNGSLFYALPDIVPAINKRGTEYKSLDDEHKKAVDIIGAISLIFSADTTGHWDLLSDYGENRRTAIHNQGVYATLTNIQRAKNLAVFSGISKEDLTKAAQSYIHKFEVDLREASDGELSKENSDQLRNALATLTDAINDGYAWFSSLSDGPESVEKKIEDYFNGVYNSDDALTEAAKTGTPLSSDIVVPVSKVGDNLIYKESEVKGGALPTIYAHIPAGTKVAKRYSLAPNGTPIHTMRGGYYYDWAFDDSAGVVRKEHAASSRNDDIYAEIEKSYGYDLKNAPFSVDNISLSIKPMLDKTPNAVGSKSLMEYYFGDGDGYQAEVVLMSPKDYLDFLKRAGNMNDDVYEDIRDDSDTAKYTKDMANGDKFPMPALKFDQQGNYDGQEGRHRAFAAINNHINLIPVAIKYPAKENWFGRFAEQVGLPMVRMKLITPYVSDIITNNNPKSKIVDLYYNHPNGTAYTPVQGEYNIADYGVYDIKSIVGMQKAARELFEPNKDVVKKNKEQIKEEVVSLYDATQPGGVVNRLNNRIRKQVAQGTLPKDSVSTRVGAAIDLLDSALESGDDGYGGWDDTPEPLLPETIDEISSGLESILLGSATDLDGVRGYRIDSPSVVIEGSPLHDTLSEIVNKVRIGRLVQNISNAAGEEAVPDERVKQVIDNLYKEHGKKYVDEAVEIVNAIDNGGKVDPIVSYIQDVINIRQKLDDYAPNTDQLDIDADRAFLDRLKGELVDLVIKYNESLPTGFSKYMKPLSDGWGEKGSHNVKVDMVWDVRGIAEYGNQVNTGDGIRTRVQDLQVGQHVFWPSLDYGSFNLEVPNAYASGDGYGGGHRYFVLTGSPKETGLFFYGDPKNFGAREGDEHIHARDGGALVHPMNMGATIVAMRELAPDATLIIQIRDNADGTPYSGPIDGQGGGVEKITERIRTDEVISELNNILGTEYGVPSEYFPDETSALEWQKQGGERAIYKLDKSSDVLERPPVTTDTLQEQPLLLTAGGNSSAHIQRFNDLMLTMPTLADSPVDYTNGIVDIVNVVRDIYSQVAMNINMDQLYENYGRAIAAGETPTATPNERATLQPLTQVLDALGHYFDPSGKSLTQEFYLPTGLKPKKQVNIVDAILGKDGAVDEDNPVDGNLDDILLDPLRVGDSGFWQKRTGDLFRDADGNFTMDKSGTLEENLIAYTVSALTRGKNKLAVAANNEVARSKIDKNRSQITSKQALAMLKDADTVRTKSRGIQAKIAKDSEALAELKENYSGDESTIDKAIKEKNYAKELNYTNSVNTMAQKGGYNQFLQMNPIQGSTLRFGANANGFRGIANIRRKLEKVNVTGTMWVERYGEKVNVGFGLEAGEANFKTYGHFRPEPAVNLGTLINLHFDADRSAAAFLNQIHTNLQNWANGEGWDLMSAISEFARENFPLITDYEWATAQLMKKIGQNYHKYHNPEEAYIANAEEISKWIRKNTLSCFNNAIMMSNISNLDNRTIEALDEAAAYMLVGTPVKRSKAINYAQEAAVWSALGLNPRVAIGNLLNEPLRLIDVVGYKGFASAWKTALNPKEAARINNILSDLPSRFDNPEMVGLAEKAKGTFGKLKDKASNAALSPLEKSEQFKNILFWAAAEQNAAARFPGDKSRQLQETLRFFNDYAIAGGKGTTPGIATGSFGRTLNIFKTFTLRNFDDFIDFVEKVARGESGNNYWDKKYEKKHKDNNYKDKTGRNKFDPKIAARVIGGRIFRSYIFWLLVGSYFGKSFIDSLGGDPSGITEGGYDQGLYDDPDTDDYEGMTDFDNFVNSLPAGFILGALQDMYFAARRRGVEQGQFLGFDVLNDPRFTKSLESKLPLGVAKNRFADMLDLIDRGYSFSSTGRKTYAAPETALDVVKGFLFGKSTTQNSLAYGKYRYGMVDIWGDLSSGDWMDFAMNANPISGNAEFDTTRKDYTGVFNGSWNDISTMQLIIQRFRERQQTIINEFNQDKYRYGGEWDGLTDEQKVAKAKEIRSKKIDEYTEDVVRAVEAFTNAGNALSDKQITTMMYLFDFHEGEEDDEWNSSYARERYVEAGLPDYDAAGIQRKEQTNNGETTEKTRNILDRSLILQNAQQGFYGSSKKAANAMKDALKDFNSTYKEYNARVKALNEEYFAARKKNKKSAEAKRLSTEIEKVQNEYLDKLYDKLSPVIERYGTALVGTYDGADVLEDYMGNMIPYSSIKKYGQTFSSGNDIVYGQLTEWLQKRYGRNAPTAPSDKEVTNGITEIKKLLDQGKTATAKSKARAILEKIGRGSLGARRDDVETLRSYAYD